MPTARDTILHLPGEGGVEAALLSQFLDAFSQAHNSYLAFERLMERPWYRDYPYRRGFLFDIAPAYADEMVSASERVVVVRVELASPGFWDLLGVSRALDVARQFLVDRDERKKDRAYRNREEERRLGLQNDILELERIRQQIEIGKEAGFTEDEIQILARRLLEPPLERLGDLQDRGVIDASKSDVRNALPPGE